MVSLAESVTVALANSIVGAVSLWVPWGGSPWVPPSLALCTWEAVGEPAPCSLNRRDWWARRWAAGEWMPDVGFTTSRPHSSSPALCQRWFPVMSFVCLINHPRSGCFTDEETEVQKGSKRPLLEAGPRSPHGTPCCPE